MALRPPLHWSTSHGRRLASLLLIGIIAISWGPRDLEASARKIRQYGFAGTYRGILKGSTFHFTEDQSSYIRNRISRVKKEGISPKPKRIRKGVVTAKGVTSGRVIKALATTEVRKNRLRVKERYFGVDINNYYGEKTIASGSKIFTVRKIGTTDFYGRYTGSHRFIGQYTDKFRELSESSKRVLAKRDLKGKLRK